MVAKPETFVVNLPGCMTKRGFWLYVWKVPTTGGSDLHYVGRTGDNSSPYAASVYRRLGQHLGDADNTNALLQHLRKRFPKRQIWDFDSFQMIACGPVFPEVTRHPDFKHGIAPHYGSAFDQHVPFRDRAAALEAKLAVELQHHGYEVLNKVASRASLGEADWLPVRDAFADHFPRLAGSHR